MWKVFHWQEQVYKQARGHRAGQGWAGPGRLGELPDLPPFPDIHQGVSEGYEPSVPG